MAERLLSVGLDVGTTSTQMIVSSITVENQASGFAVPEMIIADREILYRSPVYFTPLRGHNQIDGEGLRQLVEEEYRRAGISREQVDTGAVIITGETSRKENAATILQSLSQIAGDFVVATAGPDLESILAAKGSGAVDYSEKTGKTVLHIDIGGGTSNMALISQGRILQTGCLNVGGRLAKLDPQGKITYVSPVLTDLCDLSVGETPREDQLKAVTELLCQGLTMAAGRMEKTELLDRLATQETQAAWLPPREPVIISLSGGVADCIEKDMEPLSFGDLGVYLGRAIRQSVLGDYILGKETIRATVIGAGCHSTRLSGSTVFCHGVNLPKKNLPVVCLTYEEQESPELSAIIREKRKLADSRETVLALPGYESPDYERIVALARRIADSTADGPVYLCLQQDMAKALGQRLSLLMGNRPCLCLDKLKVSPESYLDIGAAVGPCFPVVIKTLVLSNMNKEVEP